VAVLLAGVGAGLVRALRAGGGSRLPLPQCSWLTSRWAVRVASGLGFIAGIIGLLCAGYGFVKGRYDVVPFYLAGFALITYVLLVAAPVITACSLRFKARGKDDAYRSAGQAAMSAMMAGLSAGIATEMLAIRIADEPSVISARWRTCCSTLGASCGLLLLGLYAALADGTWRTVEEAAAATAIAVAAAEKRPAGAGASTVEPAQRQQADIEAQDSWTPNADRRRFDAGRAWKVGEHDIGRTDSMDSAGRDILSTDSLGPIPSPRRGAWDSPVPQARQMRRDISPPRVVCLDADLSEPLLPGGGGAGDSRGPPHMGPSLGQPWNKDVQASNISFHSPEPSPGRVPLDSTSTEAFRSVGSSAAASMGAAAAPRVPQQPHFPPRETMLPSQPAMPQPVLAS